MVKERVVIVGTESGPFSTVTMGADQALLLESNITSVVLKEGECFCMGEKLEIDKRKYLKPFNTTIFFTVDKPCTLSFRTPFSYRLKPYRMKPLFDAFSKIVSSPCPVTLVCGGSANESAVVVKSLIKILQTEGISPLCMDVDLRSPCLCLPGTVSCAPLRRKVEDELLGFDSKIPVCEKETISFLYGDTHVKDKEFYKQLVENLTVRVAMLVKRDAESSKSGIVIHGPPSSSKERLSDIIKIVRPSSVIFIGKGVESISGIGPFEVFTLESIDTDMGPDPEGSSKSWHLSYFDPSLSFLERGVDLRSVTIINEDEGDARPVALRSGMVLGVIYSMESDPYLLKCFVCVTSVDGSKVDLLFPSRKAADMKPKFFISTKITIKDF